MPGRVGPLPAGRPRPELVAEVGARLAHLPTDATVVVACSGGPDSTTLAHLTAEARPDLSLLLVQVSHGLRTRAEERADRTVVATHAGWLGAGFVATDVDVVPDGHGTEAAARGARYAALRAVAAERRAAAILVGHTADDQAETVLLRLARGTGPDGLAAMASPAADVVRPLLRIRRADVHAFVAGEGLPTATDGTNRDLAIRRVRVREEVLPALQRIGPDPVGALARLADLTRDDVEALEWAADGWSDAVQPVGPVVALRCEALRSAPVAVARRLVRRAWSLLGNEPPAAATVGRVLGTPPGGDVTLPGRITLGVERDWRTLVRSDGRVVAPRTPLPPAGGRVPWHPAGLELVVMDEPSGDGGTGPGQIALPLPGLPATPARRHRVGPLVPGTAADRYEVSLPRGVSDLWLRAAGAGDRIRLGGGTRRVAEVLRDAHMPRAVRARWPLLVVHDRVVWIPGVAVDTDLAAMGGRDPGSVLRLSMLSPPGT